MSAAGLLNNDATAKLMSAIRLKDKGRAAASEQKKQAALKSNNAALSATEKQKKALKKDAKRDRVSRSRATFDAVKSGNIGAAISAGEAQRLERANRRSRQSTDEHQ